MNFNPNNTAYEIERTLSDAISLTDGTLQLIDDAAERNEGDVRRHAICALLERIRAYDALRR